MQRGGKKKKRISGHTHLTAQKDCNYQTFNVWGGIRWKWLVLGTVGLVLLFPPLVRPEVDMRNSWDVVFKPRATNLMK